MLATSDGLPVLDTQGKAIVLGSNYVDEQYYSQQGRKSVLSRCKEQNLKPIGITIGVFQFNNPNGLEKTGRQPVSADRSQRTGYQRSKK